MLDFIKKLFAKKAAHVEEKETVPLDSLDEWFASKSNILYKDLGRRIEIIKNKISSEIEKTRTNLEILKNSKLKNPNIPLRAKHMMEGNRESYIRIVSNFLDKIDMGNAPDKILGFCNAFSNSLDALGKSTIKSYHLLKEFFDHEVTEIAINIKNIDNLIRELSSEIRNSNIDKIEDIKKDILNIKSKISQKKEFEEELKNKESELCTLRLKKETLLKDIESVKNSEDYLNFNKLKWEKGELEKEINNIQNNIFHSFSILERALKKYSRIVLEDQKVLENYLENPVNTILTDKELRIMKILEGLERNITHGNIELDQKKKNKTLTEIKKLNRQFFINILKDYNELNEKLKSVEGKIQNSEIKKKYSDLNEKLSQVDNNLEKNGNDIEKLKKEMGRISIEELKLNLQEKINKVININISIS
jgi:hypothetical protein